MKTLVRLAAIVQGLLLGVLLAHSIFAFMAVESGVRLFRYQGF